MKLIMDDGTQHEITKNVSKLRRLVKPDYCLTVKIISRPKRQNQFKRNSKTKKVVVAARG